MEPEARRPPASPAHTDPALVCLRMSSTYMGRITIRAALLQSNVLKKK